jgi:hypothetical protein
LASGSPVVLAGPSTWNTWTTSQAGSGPFWANLSYDRNGLANIGYFISNTPGSDVPAFYDHSPGSALPYLGDGTTTFALVLTDQSQPTDFAHLLSVTGWNDDFGLFNIDTGEKHALFRAWETLGQTASFYPAGTYGFYLTSGEGHTWYSTTLDGGRNHFVLFRNESQWYLGVEDATWTTQRAADWDYNDVIVGWADPAPRIDTFSAPEPESVPDPGGTWTMFGLALMGVTAARRRWRR